MVKTVAIRLQVFLVVVLLSNGGDPEVDWT
eukprot:COSAG02_NODE_65988_length_256_cov_1.305732_1_plen_29_part_01